MTEGQDGDRTAATTRQPVQPPRPAGGRYERPGEPMPEGPSPAQAGYEAGVTGAPGAGAAQRDPTRFAPRLRQRHVLGTVFAVLCLLATLVGIIVLMVLLVDIVRDGAGRLSIAFLTGLPSRIPGRAGIGPALAGSTWTLVLTAVFAFPLGVGTAIWLEEYAAASRFKRIVETNIANLAGVPSIVYGILGLTLFVRVLSLGRSILAASLTLALLSLPVIIIAAQEAIKAVPNSIRLGAYALGATKWETIRHHVFPMALPGILTGTILALSRAIGEAAPIILVGALGFIAFVPNDPLDQYTVIPFQIYNWVSRPQAGFHEIAAAASIVLLVLLLTMNAAAIWLRNRYTQRN